MFAVPENTIAPEPVDVTAGHPVRTALEFAADRQRWRNLLRYDPDERFAVLLDDAHGRQVWLLSWLPGQCTGLHDHGDTTGAFTVVSGRLTETVLRPGPSAPSGTAPDGAGRRESLVVTAGQSRVFGPGYVHEVRNAGPDPVISVHVYTDGPRTVRPVPDAAPGASAGVAGSAVGETAAAAPSGVVPEPALRAATCVGTGVPSGT